MGTAARKDTLGELIRSTLRPSGHVVTRHEHPNGLTDGKARRIRHLRIACGEIHSRILEIDDEPYLDDSLVEPRHYKTLLMMALEELRGVISELAQPHIPTVALRRYRVPPQQMSLGFTKRSGAPDGSPPSSAPSRA